MSLGKYLYWKNIHLVENADIILCQKSLEKRLEREREVIEFKDKKWWWLTWWWERCARTRLSRSCRPVPATKPGLLWSNSKCSEPPICEGSRETNPREGWRGSSFRCCCNETENLRDNFTTLQTWFTDFITFTTATITMIYITPTLPPPITIIKTFTWRAEVKVFSLETAAWTLPRFSNDLAASMKSNCTTNGYDHNDHNQRF